MLEWKRMIEQEIERTIECEL